MNVQELIDELLKIPESQRTDLEVTTEGCDCDGDVGKIVVLEASKEAYLQRCRGTSDFPKYTYMSPEERKRRNYRGPEEHRRLVE
jgi:hypothetical protein